MVLMEQKCDICGEKKPMVEYNNRYNHILAPSIEGHDEAVMMNKAIIKTKYWICNDCRKETGKILQKIVEFPKDDAKGLKN